MENETCEPAQKQITLFNKVNDVLEVSVAIRNRIYGVDNTLEGKTPEQPHPRPENKLSMLMDILDESLRILRKSRDGLDIIK